MLQFFRHFLGNVLFLGAAFALIPPGVAEAVSFKVLYSFKPKSGDGPTSNLIPDRQGNLYGTTYEGGIDNGNCLPYGCGVVFKLAPDRTESILYGFVGGADGQWPYGGLVMDAKGSVYGTTSVGGEGSACGTVFKVSAGGHKTTLHNFVGGAVDGCSPGAGLLAGADGSFYGTTTTGGCSEYGSCGTVFKLAADGTETVLYSFCRASNCTDGWDPQSALIADTAGNLYGTTARGGTKDAGTVFRVTPDGTETVIHSFCTAAGCEDGNFPLAGLIMDGSGNLYGTTQDGGTRGDGNVFKLSPNGNGYDLTVLYTFSGGTDGWEPAAPLILDSDGNLYGTTKLGGASDSGTVFKIAPDGTKTVLYSFLFPGKSGWGPEAGLMLDKEGHLYGTTTRGGKMSCYGNQGCGTAFRLDR